MKKFLTFLVSVLFTLSSFGQGSLNLEHMSGTIQKVGDEFVMKIQYYTGDQAMQLLYNSIMNITTNY